MYPFLNITPSPYAHPHYLYFDNTTYDPFFIPRNTFPYPNRFPYRDYSMRDKELRPPQISLSTQTIFRFRNFTMTITVSEEWRIANRLRPEDIIKSALNATCHKEGGSSTNANTEVKYCKVCQSDRKIIEIGHSDQNQIGPIRTADGLEKYTFNKCKSYCSSSRSHHHARLCICLTLPVPESPFYSAPFVLQARVKLNSKIVEEKGNESINVKSETSDSIKKEHHSPSIEHKIIEEDERSDHKGKIEDVVVYVLSISSNDVVQTVVDAFVNYFKKIVSKCVIRVRITERTAYICIFSEDSETLQEVKNKGISYIRNTDGCTNYLNADMVELGIVQKYLLTTSQN
ncbi:Uncharacterized protein QTN25_004287 [Entamoeba marina]